MTVICVGFIKFKLIKKWDKIEFDKIFSKFIVSIRIKQTVYTLRMEMV